MGITGMSSRAGAVLMLVPLSTVVAGGMSTAAAAVPCTQTVTRPLQGEPISECQTRPHRLALLALVLGSVCVAAGSRRCTTVV